MARKPTSREIVLIVMLGAVAVAVFAFDVGGAGLGGGGGIQVDEVQVGEAPTVNMARLSLEPDGYDPNGRDLFKYGPPPAVARPKPPPPKETPRVTAPRRPPTPRPQRKAPVRAAPTAVAPQPKFEYLGHIGPKDGWIAAFQKDDEILVAGIGDKIDDDFTLREFKYRSVVLGYVDEKWDGQSAELELKEARSRRRR